MQYVEGASENRALSKPGFKIKNVDKTNHMRPENTAGGKANQNVFCAVCHEGIHSTHAGQTNYLRNFLLVPYS